MKIDAEGFGSYVQKVRKETHQYVQDLLKENEQLRRLVACLDSENENLLKEKKDLSEQLAAMREMLARHEQNRDELRKELTNIEAENQRFADRYSEVESQNNNLANLYVASYRLHGTLDRQEVLEAVKEIVINLIGSEELAIFETNREKTALSLVDSFGLELGSCDEIPVGQGLIGQVAASGETYVAGQSESPPDTVPGMPFEERLTACIPLKVDDQVTGTVALFRLLPQKTQGLESIDHELFDLLATQAATALYSTTLQSLWEEQAASPVPS